MSQINISRLTFYYEGSFDNIFENVSFQIDTDWKLGFVGRNGRGKTTFFNLLLGKYEYNGSISSSVNFDYFPFPILPEEKKELTVDLIEKLYPDYEMWKLCRECTLLQVDMDVLYRPFHTLSYGEQTKVLLALLFSKEHHFLLIDEPTNHLDYSARQILKDYLKQKKGFILVSHDRDFMDECVDHVLAINKTNIEVERGNFSSWYENKQKKDQYEYSEHQRLKKDIKRLETAARQASTWADAVEATKIGYKGYNPIKEQKSIGMRPYIGEKSRRMQQRRKNLERRQERDIEDKKQLLQNIETAEDLILKPLEHYKENLVSVKELAIWYGETQVSNAVSFTVKNHECVALKGRNGSGKTSVLKAILGEDLKTAGTVELAGGLILSYVSQDTSHLKGTLQEYASQQDLNLTLFQALLRKLDFNRIQFEKKMEDFSEGQKKKVLLSASLCTQAHLYIWDEPLNYIDIFSRMQLEQLLKKFKPAMLLVEHDEAFIRNTADKIIELH